jgi:lipopolysaccharide assembly protein A
MTAPDQAAASDAPDSTAGATTPDGTTADPAAPGGPAAETTEAPALPSLEVRRTRLGGIWAAVGLFALVLLLLLVFILENSHQVNIGFFGAHGHLPLGVALLMAAILGILLVIIPGGGRIMQLRRMAHRHRRAEAQANRT